MAKLHIEINDERSQIVITGDLVSLKSNRFAIRYMQDFLDPVYEENKILIPVNNEEIEKVVSSVRMLILKYGFEEERGPGILKVLDYYYLEESKFLEFSKKALDIKNNSCDKFEFSDFSSIVSERIANRKLYPLQLLSAYHLAFSQNACNFSVPGAGKTSIVYGAYSYLNSLKSDDVKNINRILIVGPLSSFGPWEMEYSECFGKKPNVMRIVSSIDMRTRKDYFYSSSTAEITLISYPSLANFVDDIIFYLKNNNVMVVLDEAHKIKNTNGGRIASSVLSISKFCKSRVVLTGTPAPNGYEDLFNIFKFIWPTKSVIRYQINQLRDMTLHNRDPRIVNLIDSVSPYFTRIKKSDLGIPLAIVNPPIISKMGTYQKRVYDFIEKKYMDSILEDSNEITSKFKRNLMNAKTIRLMQAATSPKLLLTPLQSIFESEEINIDVEKPIIEDEVLDIIINYSSYEIPSKFIEAKNLVERIINDGGKVVIWATFINTIIDLKDYLENEGIHAQELYGAIPVESQDYSFEEDYQFEITREKIVRDFHKDDCPYKVIIANPFAVAESISLHKACHNAIYIERTFNAAHFIQSKDRIHRYGLKQHETTNYYYILTGETIDEVIDERLEVKEQRMNEIIESMPIPLFDNVLDGIGDEDIKAILKSYAQRTK